MCNQTFIVIPFQKSLNPLSNQSGGYQVLELKPYWYNFLINESFKEIKYEDYSIVI